MKTPPPHHNPFLPGDSDPLPDEHLSVSDDLLKHWQAHQPQAKAHFQQHLEDALIQQLKQASFTQKEPLPMTSITRPSPRNLNFFWPTSLVATFSVILLGLFIMLSNNPGPLDHGSFAAPLMTATAEQGNHPTPVPLMTATLTPTPYIYTIRDGDTLLSIARLQNVDLQALLANNNLTTDTPLAVGQTLIMPSTQYNPTPPVALYSAPPVNQLRIGIITLGDIPQGAQITAGSYVLVHLPHDIDAQLALTTPTRIAQIFDASDQQPDGRYASHDIPARTLILTNDLSETPIVNFSVDLPTETVNTLTPETWVRIEATIQFVDIDENHQAPVGTTPDSTPEIETRTSTIIDRAKVIALTTEGDRTTVTLQLSPEDLATLEWSIESNISLTLIPLDAD